MHSSPSPSIRERLIHAIGGYSSLLLWYRAKRPRWLWRLVSPFGKPTSRYVSDNGWKVSRGPFEGLLFPQKSLGHTNYLSAKLAGTYEPPVVEFLADQAGGCELFVDLGSGDGFFCTGVARKATDLRIIGYEVNRYEQDLAVDIAATNGVRIEPRGLVDQDELKQLPDGKLLLLCDLEGLEEDFLDPVAVPRLLEATMAVEAHEQFRPNVIQTLTERFEATHEVTWIPASPFDPGTLPELKGWDPEAAELAVYDGHRPGEGWLTFVPREA